MDRQSLTTPSTTPSSDPRTQASSHEPSSPIVISSSGSESDDFKPHQLLMQTPITIECEQDLSAKLTVHEELLCCHSKLLEERFAEAKALRQQYEQASVLRGHMATLAFPEVTADEFEKNNHQEKVDTQRQILHRMSAALPLIISTYERYPLGSYCKTVRQCIAKATEEQVSSKNVKTRMLQTALREGNWKARITLINSLGVHAISAELFGLFHRIDKQETAKAKEDVMRAAAQKRILVPHARKETVRFVMQWIYQRDFECQDPQQLYNTMQLAKQLGIEALSEICLTRLCNAVQDSMQNAMVTGTTLTDLLGYGPDPSNNVIGVIFKHSLKDHDTPKRIQELVVDALAANLDTDLWAKLKNEVSHSIALRVIDAMLKNRQKVLKGVHGHGIIKYEEE